LVKVAFPAGLTPQQIEQIVVLDATGAPVLRGEVPAANKH
jgi:hypothetical protein